MELQEKELKTQIRDALKVLNQREAMVAQLYYVEELNIYEISDILEISTEYHKSKNLLSKSLEMKLVDKEVINGKN